MSESDSPDLVDRATSSRPGYLRALLASIVEASDDAIVSKTLDGVILSWNGGAERIFGYTAAEAVGQPITLIIPEELRDEERSILERLRRGERVDHFQTVRVAKDGRRLDISLTVSPVRDDDGKIVGASKIARDISEQIRSQEALRESEERLRLALEAGRMGTWEWSMATAGVVWSPGLEEIHGLEPGTFEGTFEAFQKVTHPDDREKVRALIAEALERGEEYRVDYRIVCPDGTVRWVEARGRFVEGKDGAPGGMVGICADITDRKRAEQALHEADRRKNEFLATLAHELRNPLAPIRNALEIIKRAGGDRDLLRQGRGAIERQVAHMVRLVDDLLDVSRITRDELELRKTGVELASVVHQAVATWRPLAERENQTIEVRLPSEPVYLDADPVRLAQIFSNLLHNACKYTPPGGSISLVAEAQGGEVVANVKDTGIGICPEQLGSIFEMFTRADTTLERSRDGLGIGLTLVKRLVEMHGGTIEAHSEGEGWGSEFSVRLPRLAGKPAAHERPVATANVGPGPARHRVLVVDDNVDSADSLATLMYLSGHETRIAYDGEEALAAAEEFRPEVILLDIGLPKVHGFGVCRGVREKPWGEDVVIVALTGWGQDEDRQRSQEAGFDRHIVKPVDYQALTELLDSLLAEKEGQAASG
jgi:two-component system CheB/CheR fusion protein